MYGKIVVAQATGDGKNTERSVDSYWTGLVGIRESQQVQMLGRDNSKLREQGVKILGLN